MPEKPFEDYLNDYLDENIGIESYADEGAPDPRAKQLAEALIAGATAEGYTDEDIAPWKSDLERIIADRFESNTDAEVRRLAAEDD
ncbi:hypothetical protein [Rhizobium leguminosarum]|uniref:hypothetical protein n=1 Tax=Rhizobium leguminosarum TaxID=384 RepID=UPI0013B908B4|nr:hypothetical protein [Rhizobium leguminosarum]MBY5325264.1 hypothetical protein [Rhizobium leguminosarum]MBY5381448.1 hypothetical protein [Rhizobium leguminosarum]MCA2432820.1 hypothetical protein [Rhizobium leguminosarum]NEH74716.1 hypothetical protein [Rhizobium leguminosarum]